MSIDNEPLLLKLTLGKKRNSFTSDVNDGRKVKPTNKLELVLN